MADDKTKKGQEPTPPAEPVQEMAGGPGTAPTPDGTPTPPAPKLVPVKYGSREILVPEDAAQAWQEREREFQQSFSRQGEELGQLRRWRQQIESTVQPQKPTEPDLNTLWFENPVEAAKLIERRVETRLESRYRQERAVEKFWDGFYRKHDDLREDDFIVQAVLDRNLGRLADLPVAEAQDELAKLVRTELLRISRKTKTDDTNGTRRPVAEPASGERAPRPVVTDADEGPTSLSEAIRRMQQSKRPASRVRGA